MGRIRQGVIKKKSAKHYKKGVKGTKKYSYTKRVKINGKWRYYYS